MQSKQGTGVVSRKRSVAQQFHVRYFVVTSQNKSLFNNFLPPEYFYLCITYNKYIINFLKKTYTEKYWLLFFIYLEKFTFNNYFAN